MNTYFAIAALAVLLAIGLLVWKKTKGKKAAKGSERKLTAPNSRFIPAVKEIIDEGHTATFTVHGFSMRIFIENNRDKVWLGPCSRKPEYGDVVLAEVRPQLYVLHRVIKVEGDRLTLQGDGNVYGTESCQVKDVIGIALGFYRKNRKKPDLVTGWKWRTYSKIWLALKPVRRWILAVYRRLPFRI